MHRGNLWSCCMSHSPASTDDYRRVRQTCKLRLGQYADSVASVSCHSLINCSWVALLQTRATPPDWCCLHAGEDCKAAPSNAHIDLVSDSEGPPTPAAPPKAALSPVREAPTAAQAEANGNSSPPVQQARSPQDGKPGTPLSPGVSTVTLHLAWLHGVRPAVCRLLSRSLMSFGVA